MDNIQTILDRRVTKRFPKELLGDLGVPSVYMAGNSLNKSDPNDLDLYPVGKSDFDLLKGKLEGVSYIFILKNTKNSLTIKYKNQVIQLCNYFHPSLQSLVNSFDYAHIQIGVRVSEMGMEDIYYTSDWVNSHLSESTYYTKSEYPLSSLVRMFKYKERGNFAGNSHIYSVICILKDIVKRGFKDYQDFKDQLDAVDLGLLPEDFAGTKEALKEFYELLTKEKQDD
jgi:hypothetical protein